MNTLYCADNLEILRQYIADDSVDLIYIDPPFNSKRDYNIFFDDKDIKAQRIAFEDTWTLKNVQKSMADLNRPQTEDIYILLKAYQKVAPSAFPYLVMMISRIFELHRVLKPTGSFYLHCDPTMSHYLKTLCDIIFGKDNFRNEIVWCYTGASSKGQKQFPRKHDIIFWYSKSSKWIFNEDDVKVPYSQATLKRAETTPTSTFHGIRTHRTLKDGGKIVEDYWNIPIIGSTAKERLGYPTQKPLALLERIIKVSSNEGDVVLDAFCGCGTTVDAAEKLNRRWIGIDISPMAINLIKNRLKKEFNNVLSKYEILGLPVDTKTGIELWEKNHFAFQDWWITKFDAFSATFGKKGPDQGVDGIAHYRIDHDENIIKAVFQVKGGRVESRHIDELWGTMEKHKCQLGVFLSIKPLTKPMLKTIADSGYVVAFNKNYPKLQSLTLDEFFSGKVPQLPPENVTFRKPNTVNLKAQIKLNI